MEEGLPVTEVSRAIIDEVDPRPIMPLDPTRPMYDETGREYPTVTASSKQVVTLSCGIFGVWDRKTGECLISGCEGLRLSNERPSAEWVAKRRQAAAELFSAMHADAAINRVRESSSGSVDQIP